MGREAELMRAAGTAGVPSPRILLSDDSGDALGTAFVVMSRVEGETVPRRILRQPEYAAARAGSPPSAVATWPASTPSRPMPSRAWRSATSSTPGPHPGRARAAAPRLRARAPVAGANRPADVAATLVHGDFRNGNFIVGPEGIRAVLDWELAHLGDPLEDLGWLCVKSWRFGVAAGRSAGSARSTSCCRLRGGERRAVDRDALHWWEVLGTLKWGVICIMQAAATGPGRSAPSSWPRSAAGSPRHEWDLLELLP